MLRDLVAAGVVTAYEARRDRFSRPQSRRNTHAARSTAARGSRRATTGRGNKCKLWFATITFRGPTYSIDEHDPDMERKLQDFLRTETARAFRVNERGPEEHRLHKHIIMDMKQTCSYEWIEKELKACGSASDLVFNIKRVKGGKLGTFHGMLGYCIKGKKPVVRTFTSRMIFYV